ncbi:hypothetical protein JR316_0013314 [Psilocybe cubensis]|uniref:Uncharacterized protein n=2 Tax=Psilocybe cubensis TaxID=181762 RepID=A0ACB8GGR3_PSICU|nr:hypothetical protein JR316_0013314 [Psilocybe cubensis]KAH9474846.1 hypothetical protein JR316_0013314 [Psilocybe cubensis]
MIQNDDPFAPVLLRFLESGYKFEEPFPDYRDNPEPSNPLNLYDRHLSPSLLLKNIRHAPWITKELSKICEDTITEFTSAGHKFDKNRNYWKHFREKTYDNDCVGVADCHFDRISVPCNAYASKLLFSPNDPVWFSFLVPRVNRSYTPQKSFRCDGEISMIKPKKKDNGDRELEIPPETRSTLDSDTLSKIDKLRGLKSIFNYEFFIKAKSAEALLNKMNRWGAFKWEMPTVTGAPALPTSPPCMDSPIIHSLFPSIDTSNPRSTLASTKPPGTKRKVIAPMKSNEKGESRYRINAQHYIQKAWVDAVDCDVTFIVFTCGKKERVAIRHRQSQTLYLSDLIDPMRMPGYRQMHLGLTIAALKDRLAMLDQKESSNKHSSKRKTPPQDPVSYNTVKDKATRRQRRRLDPELEITTHEIDKKAAKRDLLLFYLNFEMLCSPAPSSFQRMEPSCVSRPFQNQSYHFKRKPSYPPESYILVTAHQDDIGHGAMGLIYRVTVEIEMNDGSKHQRPLILKLAIGLKKDQIIREYEMYKRLAEADVTYGIVGVHGLFHDMESDAMLLIMEDAGKSLRTRAIEKNLKIHYDWDDSVETTEEECNAFVEVLEGIHNAHVVHQDLRIDNLMMNDAGDVFIIDFDNGEYDPFKDSFRYKRDTEDLLDALGWAVSEDDESDGDDESDEEDEDEDGGEDCEEDA